MLKLVSMEYLAFDTDLNNFKVKRQGSYQSLPYGFQAIISFLYKYLSSKQKRKGQESCIKVFILR